MYTGRVFVDCRGVEYGKALSFHSNRQGFESIVTRIHKIRSMIILRYPVDTVIVGMGPTGHYWKPLANYLMELGYRVVGVNPFHTKKAKELDDNSLLKKQEIYKPELVLSAVRREMLLAA